MMTITNDERLQYYMHDDVDAFRLELSGSLSGQGARSVYQAWRTALSILGGRPVITNKTFVTDADERGRGLLQLWHRHGVRIKAASAQSCALAKSILGEPVSVPTTTSGNGWLHRLTTAIRDVRYRCRNSGTRRTSAWHLGTSAKQKL